MTIAVFGGASPDTVVPKEHTRVLDELKHASIARFVLALQALDLPNSSDLDKCILIGFSQAASAGDRERAEATLCGCLGPSGLFDEGSPSPRP